MFKVVVINIECGAPVTLVPSNSYKKNRPISKKSSLFRPNSNRSFTNKNSPSGRTRDRKYPSTSRSNKN